MTPEQRRIERAAEKNQVSIAAILRENQFLRLITDKALRLRRAGIRCDEHGAAMEKFWADNPHITKSATQGVMLEQAFNTCLAEFDQAVADAADAGFEFAREHYVLGPVSLTAAQSEQKND